MKVKQSLVLVTLLTTVLILPGSVLAQEKKPNILVIFGDDIGQTNVSAYSMGVMGYKTPNIDRIAKEGMIFTDYYAEQSCTAGRSSFITGQCTLRSEEHTSELQSHVNLVCRLLLEKKNILSSSRTGQGTDAAFCLRNP